MKNDEPFIADVEVFEITEKNEVRCKYYDDGHTVYAYLPKQLLKKIDREQLPMKYRFIYVLKTFRYKNTGKEFQKLRLKDIEPLEKITLT